MSDTEAATSQQIENIIVRPPKSRVDLATVLGLTIALGLIGSALWLGGSPGAFLNGPAALIVLLGTLAVTSISYTAKEFFSALRVIKQSLLREEFDPREVARELLDISSLARKHGILALQKVDEELRKDRFLHKAVTMVSDGHTSDEINRVLGQEIDAQVSRHQQSANMVRRAAEIAPAMGLIGTLVGLVQMLSQLDDPSSIGPAMAVALLTTFYGALLGTVIFSPLAAKLERNSVTEATIKTLILTGITSIARQENPRRLEMLLNSELPPAQRIKYFD